MSKRGWIGLAALAAVLLAGTTAVAFSGDDEEESPWPKGVVEAKPAGATQVDVAMSEWAIIPDRDSVKAGTVYFLVENRGPNDPHEFVVIRTDGEPGELPVIQGRVPEDEVDMVDEIHPYRPKTTASIALDLEPGKYALICNVAEVEDGEIESHYELGMYTAFTVTP